MKANATAPPAFYFYLASALSCIQVLIALTVLVYSFRTQRRTIELTLESQMPAYLAVLEGEQLTLTLRHLEGSGSPLLYRLRNPTTTQEWKILSPNEKVSIAMTRHEAVEQRVSDPTLEIADPAGRVRHVLSVSARQILGQTTPLLPTHRFYSGKRALLS